MADADCTFCGVVDGRSPSNIRYEDEDFVVFDNLLRWAPVMLLVAPRTHMSQTDMWNDGPLLARMGELAVRLGNEYAPGGFRLLSNFGADALQTQPHGHLHIVGGTFLGHYVRH